MIPYEAVAAANKSLGMSPNGLTTPEIVRLVLEAAAPHMLVHVHHHDIESHARSFNEGYEAAMAHMADT